MKKQFRRLLSIMFILVLCSTMMLPVVAMEPEKGDDEEEVEQYSLIFPEILDDGGIPLTQIFVMTNLSVTQHVNTYGSSTKYIKRSELPSNVDLIQIKGELIHNMGDGSSNQIRAGIGTYNYTGEYVPPISDLYMEPVSDIFFSQRLCWITALGSNTKYYGFVDNLVGYGSVEGEVGFYYG